MPSSSMKNYGAGPTGATGVQNVFISATAPTGIGLPATYVWFQTGLGPNGQDITLWIEDGQS